MFAVDGLVGATPELLVRREKGLVTSRVLAGHHPAHRRRRRTTSRSRPSLARSSKDLEEHEYAVRSVADALAPHCSSMNVPESPVRAAPAQRACTWPPTSPGSSPTTRPSLALAASLHPSAAVCGTPTAVADAVIAELEQHGPRPLRRPGRLDRRAPATASGASRCAAAPIDADDPPRIRLFAGCGIVAGSDPEAEVAESDAKLVPMRDALLRSLSRRVTR